jgi:hypothetical protein
MKAETDKELRELARKAAVALGAKATISEEDAAALACIFRKDVYKSLDVPENDHWTEIEIANTDSGFDSLCLHHTRSKTLVFVNRGADGGFPSRDFWNGAQAAVGKLVDTLEDSIIFAEDCKSWCDKHGFAIDQVLCVGVSWGGALTDCQAALLPGVFGMPAAKIRGVGFASAGFQEAISRLADKRGVSVDDAETRIQHYIREADPIRLASFSGYFGSVQTIGSVFVERLEQAHKTNLRWFFHVDPLKNHSGLLYWRYYGKTPKGTCIAVDRDQDLRIIDKANPN